MLSETRSTRKTWRAEILPSRSPTNLVYKRLLPSLGIGNIGPAIKHSHWSILVIGALGCLGLVINRYIVG